MKTRKLNTPNICMCIHYTLHLRILYIQHSFWVCVLNVGGVVGWWSAGQGRYQKASNVWLTSLCIFVCVCTSSTVHAYVSCVCVCVMVAPLGRIIKPTTTRDHWKIGPDADTTAAVAEDKWFLSWWRHFFFYIYGVCVFVYFLSRFFSLCLCPPACIFLSFISSRRIRVYTYIYIQLMIRVH